MKAAAFWIWQIGSVTTFLWLMAEDWSSINWWNWLLIFPINLFLGEIWPIYWLILRPLMGG